MEMLCKTSSKVGKLHRDFCLPSSKMDMTTGCIKIRQTLEALFRARGEQKALKFKFNTENQVLATDVFFRIEVDLNPKQLMPASTDAKARATKNLEGFELFENQREASFESNLNWLKKLQWDQNTLKMQVGLATVEILAQQLEDHWSEYDLHLMEDLIDEYLKLCDHFRCDAQWKVELRSREALVVWIGFCAFWSALPPNPLSSLSFVIITSA